MYELYQIWLLLNLIPRRVLIGLGLVFIIIFAFLLRCLHLFNPDYYYIVSPDSHFFHWMSERISGIEPMPAEWPGALHSGLAYPLAYIAKAIGFVFGMSPTDALTFTAKFLPPTLGVISIVVIYLAVSKIYNQRVALFSAFAWAILLHSLLIGAAGYLDRDGLSVLLIMMAAFIFYLSKDWHLKVGNLDLGWLVGGLAVLAIEAMLFVEWLWIGPLLLLTILTAYFVLAVLARSYQYIAPSLMEVKDILSLTKESLAGLAGAVRESSWRPFALIIGLSALVGGITPGFPYMFRLLGGLARVALSPGEGMPVVELQGLSLNDLLGYHFLIFPLLIGLLITVVRRREADLLCLGWFVCLFFLGLFARRVFLCAAPAACLLCGLGLAYLFDFQRLQPLFRYVKIAVAAFLLFLLLLVPCVVSYQLASVPRMAVNDNWYEALVWLKEKTPQEAVVISWWDYGYWILDVAERKPLVDNGFYGYDLERLEDVGLAYCTTEASEAAQIMQKYKADYLVFSEIEVISLPAISWYGLGEACGDGLTVPEELEDSLYNRALYGDFPSGQGLKVVHQNDEVVILGLE